MYKKCVEILNKLQSEGKIKISDYQFPPKQDLKLRLKDMLEDEVDEKYYLSDKMMNYIVANNEKWTGNNDKSIINKAIASAINTGEGSRRCDASNYVSDNYIENLNIKEATKKGYKEAYDGDSVNLAYPDSKTRRGRVQDSGETCPTITCGSQDICYIGTPCIAASRGRNPENPSDRTAGSPTEQRLEINHSGTSNTITTVQKDNYVLEPMENDQEYINNISDEYKFTKSKCQEMFDSNGCLPEMFNPYNKAEVTEIAPTQTTMCDRSCSSATVLIKQPQFRIRKLTPLECFRLMGFDDADFEKASQVCSNSQLYKQAGNSIVVNVLEAILTNLLK